ncbi:MAG: hypothetical protein V4723_03615 [Pseudomonadota bacterium]
MTTDTTAVPAADSGLSSVAQIEALADQLSQCADELHARIMRDMNANQSAGFSEEQQALARSLLDEAAVLRQRANGLYADAAALVVKSLGASQAQLMQLTADAGEKIRKIAKIGHVVGLVSGLVMLAGAAATGQAVPIIVAIEKIRRQSKRIEALTPKKPA